MLFNPYKGFLVEQIMIGDAHITEAMLCVAEARRDPFGYWLARAMAVGGLCAAVAFASGGYGIYKSTEGGAVILEAVSHGCIPSVIYGKDTMRGKVRQEFQILKSALGRAVLEMSSVSSLAELLEKNRVVMCESF